MGIVVLVKGQTDGWTDVPNKSHSEFHLAESSAYILEALTSLHVDLILTLGPQRSYEASGQGSSMGATAGKSHWE